MEKWALELVRMESLFAYWVPGVSAQRSGHNGQESMLWALAVTTCLLVSEPGFLIFQFGFLSQGAPSETTPWPEAYISIGLHMNVNFTMSLGLYLLFI